MKKIQNSENRFILWIMSILLTASVILLIAGIAGFSREKPQEETNQISGAPGEEKNVSLGKYFEDTEGDNSKSIKGEDIYLRDDPFKKICGNTSAEGEPSVSSNTVCIR